MDYIWAKNANEALYQHAIKLMNEYKGKEGGLDEINSDDEMASDIIAVVSPENEVEEEDHPKFESDYVEEKLEPALIMPAVQIMGEMDHEDENNEGPTKIKGEKCTEGCHFAEGQTPL